jgi:transketolase
VIVTGSLAENVADAAELLARQGVEAEVLGMPTVWPLDGELIMASAEATKRVVTVEEHYDVGGLGSMVQELLCEQKPLPVKRLGIPHAYAATGRYPELLANYGLDAQGIANHILKFIEN